MYFVYLIEGPFLWIAFLVLISTVTIRLALKLYVTIRSSKDQDRRWYYVLTTFGRMSVPFHKAAGKKPFYSAIRYILHICLITVPIWYSGHIALWEDSQFEWYWSPIPDVWADGMTLALLALAAGMVIHRVIFPKTRSETKRSEWLNLLLVILPFASGYLLTHGTLESIPFFSEYLLTLHILAGELLFLIIGFLFLRARIDPQACVGCTACELNCPTGALDYKDKADQRTFRYTPYQCIACGNCVISCPEGAVRLQHHVSFAGMVTSLFKQEIGSVKLLKCAGCGNLFAPQPQVDKIAHQIESEYVRLCEDCKEYENTAVFYQEAS